MALIQCKNCGEDISDKAKSCPHCGCNLNEEVIPSKELENHIICEECGKDMPCDSLSCPHCGCPISNHENENKLDCNKVLSMIDEIKKKFSVKTGIILVTIAFVLGAIFVSSNSLTGDDKVAYELIVEAADNFKDPSSVRLTSGTLGVDGDCIFCGISAKNGFGTRGTDYYFIMSGTILEEEDDISWLYTSTDQLNIDKINKKLAKALSFGD